MEKEEIRDQNKQLISAEGFTNPANEYRGLQIVHEFLSLNGNTYDKKAETVKNAGWGGVVTNESWDSKYLIDDKKLARLNEFVQAVDKAGLRVWLYDEKGYPSGSGGDLVVKDNPEYEAIVLLQLTVTGNGAKTVTVDAPEAFRKIQCTSILSDSEYSVGNATYENGKISVKGVDGVWVAYVYCVVASNCKNDYNQTYPNLLNKDAVKKFLDVTYETYYRSIDNFEEIVEAWFDDEVGLTATRNLFTYDLTNPVIPYNHDIFTTFKEKYGYDLEPLLPLLYNSQNATAKRARANFYSHVGDILSETFFAQIQEWCVAHNCELSGHLLLEEEMKHHIPIYGDYVQASKEMGYPGFDILNVRPQAYIGGISTGGKYASSAAWLTGAERVMVEICPVHEPEEFATNHLDYALGTMTFAYFDGGNQITSYYGQANRDPATGNPFNEYIGRLGSMLVGAQNLNQVAIFYALDSVGASYMPPVSQSVYRPVEQAKVNDALVAKLAAGIRKAGLDYVFLDEQSIKDGKVTSNSLEVGEFDFTTIIVPRASVIDVETMKTFDALIKKGVNVIYVGSMPELSFYEKDQAELEALSKAHQTNFVQNAEQAVKAITTKVALTVDSNQTVYVSPYDKDGVYFFYLANASDYDTNATFNYEGATGYRIYDALTGEITEVESSYEIKSYRGIFVQPII